MKYELRNRITFDDQIIDLTEKEFESIKEYSKNLLEVKLIEEKFDILIKNFFDYEMNILESSHRQMLYGYSKSFHGDEEIFEINRMIANLLSSCRIYIDHTQNHLDRIYGGNTVEISRFKKIVKDIYDNNFSYRFMYELRNHVQHNSLPVSVLRYPAPENSGKENELIKYGIKLEINIEDIKRDKEIVNKRIFSEIENMKVIQLIPIIRFNTECIWKIHKFIRELISLFPIGTIERIKLLVDKNSNFDNISIKFVSGEPLLEKEKNLL